MIDDYIDEIITQSIPPKKYSHEWDSELLKNKIEETFKINLPISNWFEEDGVDEEEIVKRIKDQVNQKLKDILDLDFREKLILIPLVVSVLLIGIFPNIFLDPMRQSIETIITNFEIANGK